jgi:predicted amidophosphoribosyltransferase
VPVPIRPFKYLRRGYNFPALIGSTLAGRTRWPFAPALLHRNRESRPQAGLPISEREDNVRGAFFVPKGARVPAEILLLDDVYTSGATATACARALQSAGGETIVVLTVACAVL